MNIPREKIDIIIPTMDNEKQLIQCCNSILNTVRCWPVRLIIVNNGKNPLEGYFSHVKAHVTLLNPGSNLGWTGGLKYGLKHSKSKFVMFANDDIFIPVSSISWIPQLVTQLIVWPKIAAVGPASNTVMGRQNMWAEPYYIADCPTFLIGFCMLVRRSTLDEVGGIDDSFVTGDDIDLSIRFLKAGYIIMTNRSVFVYHHGFQTGLRTHGEPDKPGGWNSREMTEDTNKHLIQKHGFMAWYNTMCKSLNAGWFKGKEQRFIDDMAYGKGRESDIVLSSVNGCDPSEILEVGCGGTKTVVGSVGLDKEKKGTVIPFTGKSSVADIVADAQLPLPLDGKKYKILIARHVLEHCVDVIGALNSWKDALDNDGTMIISVPDENITNTVFLNSEHVHAFTPESLAKIIESVGMKVTKTSDRYCADSFTLEIKKGTDRRVTG